MPTSVRCVGQHLRQLVAFEAIAGDWSYIHDALARVRQVTAEDVTRVARTYLTARNRTVGLLQRPVGATTGGTTGTTTGATAEEASP